MKKDNKGFSLVELIIVIAIMAILAGVLAPALIKYIAKARLSADIQMGDTIGKTYETALANETPYWEAVDVTPAEEMENVFAKQKQEARDELKDIMGTIDGVVGKSKKDINGNSFAMPGQFYVCIDRSVSKIEVYYGGDQPGNMVFPSHGNLISK